MWAGFTTVSHSNLRMTSALSLLSFIDIDRSLWYGATWSREAAQGEAIVLAVLV
jgi:hypothetical protein